MRRLDANQWMLIAVGGVLLVAAADYIRGTVAARTPPPAPTAAKKAYDPPFEEGGNAPDFTLPDRRGRRVSLSSLARGETLVSFVSDEPRSRALLRYIARVAAARKKLGKLPRFVSVADFDPAKEDEFVRDTSLPQTILYEGKDHPVSRQYHSEVHPRCFQLIGGLQVSVIGKSPSADPMFQLGQDIRIGWQMRSPALNGLNFQGPEPTELKKFDLTTNAAASGASPAPHSTAR